MSTAPARPASLNWKEIDLLLSEMDPAGTFIQEVRQPAHDRVVLELFRPGGESTGGPGQSLHMLLCASQQYPRVHTLSGRPGNPAKPPRFCMFLRARIGGGRIVEASQAGAQRIVALRIAHADGERILYARLWGSAANLLLTDAEGRILDVLFRRPKRGEVSGGSFVPEAGYAAPAKEYAVRRIDGEGPFCARVERYFRELESSGGRERLLAQAQAALEGRDNAVASNLSKLRRKLSEYADRDRAREIGDLITSSLHLVRKGDEWLCVEDFFHDGRTVEIRLRPELSPAQNAELYYEKYRKGRLGFSTVQEEIRRLEAAQEGILRDRAFLKAIEAAQEAASRLSGPELERLKKIAGTAGERRVMEPSAPGSPGLTFHSPPYRIIVGRTAAENDELLRHKMRGNDWWFHSRDYPGAYVFVKAPAGKSLPLETMLDAASLALHYSKGKNAGAGDVYYTQVKYLRRPKEGKKGLVLPVREKNLRVKLDPARIERLRGE